MFPYVEPNVETANEIDKRQEIIDKIIDLQNEFNKVNDMAAEQKKQKKIEVTIDDVIDQEIHLALLTISGGKKTCLTIETLFRRSTLQKIY